MSFSDPTLMLAVTVVGAVNAVVLSWGALLGASRPASLYWAAGSALLAVAGSAVLLVPDPTSPWQGVLFNLTLLGSQLLWLLGTRSFFGRTWTLHWVLPPLLLILGGNLWFGLIRPDDTVRIVLSAGLAALLRLATAVELVRAGSDCRRSVAWLAALVMLVDALVFVRHAHIGWLGGAAQAGHDPYVLTWISMLLSAAVATPMLMLLGMSRLLDALWRSAHEDSLTGVLNRRGFFERVGRIADPAPAEPRLGAVLMLDVDHFKRLNDRCGHAVGDEVLRLLGTLLRSLPRGALAVRWGGEEFCVLLVPADAAVAQAVAAQIADALRLRSAELRAVRSAGLDPVTLSVGIALGRWSASDLHSLQQQADAALYQAKHAGRDRVVLVHAAQ